MATAKPKVPAPKDPIDESNAKGPESKPDASDAASDSSPVSGEDESEPEPPKEKRPLKDRVKDIEARWGKDFTEVMLDVHDHVFGTSAPVDHDASEKKEG